MEILSENEYVRIVKVSIARGQVAPAYTPAANLAVRIDLRSGPHLGEVRYSHEGWLEADGVPISEDIDEIRVELKTPVDARPMELDAVRIDPKRYKVVLENDRMRVVRLRFEGREAGLMVTHPPRVLATLTDVRVKLLFADGRRDERGAPAGVAAWLEEETLQTENASDEPLEVVLIEPKG
jgi:hypothetical protein